MSDRPLAWETTVDPDELRDIARAETHAVYTAPCREWVNAAASIREAEQLLKEWSK